MNEAETEYLTFLDTCTERLSEMTEEPTFDTISDDMSAELMSLAIMIQNLRTAYR